MILGWNLNPNSVLNFMMCTGLQAAPRDYSLPGTTTDQAFNAIGALATIAFAFNTGILPEMQVTYIS
jgi:hypothetical protein